MIGHLSARPTFFHRFPAGPKLLVLCVACTALGLTAWPGAGWVGLAVVLMLCAVPGPWFLRLVLADLKGPMVIALLIVGFQALHGRLALGLSLAGTLLACITAAMLFSRTTSPSELLDAVDRWLACLRVRAEPRRRLSLTIAMTLRFIPALSARADRLAEAHKTRSSRRPGWKIVIPLALGALDEADRAAEALRARAHLD